MSKPKNYRLEIARRCAAAGHKEAAKIIRSAEVKKIWNTDSRRLSGGFVWNVYLKILSAAAHALDDLGWEGGWKPITK